MARSVTFNGVTRYTPGGITRINAEALNQVVSSDNSIIGLVGEAEGGAPGSIGGLVSLFDPSRATDLFRSGPLVDAIKLAFQSSNDPNVPGGASQVYVYKTNASTSSSITLPGSAADLAPTVVTGGSSTTVTIASGLTNDQYNGRWARIIHSGSSYIRKITDTTAPGTFTVSPTLPFTPAAPDTISVLANSINLTSKDWGAHTTSIAVDISNGVSVVNSKVVTVSFEGEEEISPEIGGTPTFHILFKGGSVSDTDTTIAGCTKTIIKCTGALTATPGTQISVDGEYTTVVTNTGSPSVIEVTPELSEAPAAGKTVNAYNVTAGTATVSGASGVATGLTTTTTGVVDNLNITFAAGQTVRQLMDVISQNPNYTAEAARGVNPDVIYASELDFGTPSTYSILASPSIATDGPTRTTVDIVDYLNDFSSYVNATRAINSTKAGGEGPIATADPVRLEGGSRGISTNQEFQDGLDELLTVRCNSVVPLIDQNLINEGYGSSATVASVAANLAGHVAFARGAGQDTAGERGGFIGFRGNKTAIIKQANSLNDQDVALVAQNPTIVNGQGTLQEMGPRMLAVMAASMRAGVIEVAEPLTHKLIRVSGMTQDASWNPSDISDANEMIINGVLFAETIDGVGTYWVRDLTTWVKDDNLAYSEGSVRDAVRYVAHGLRTTLIERFTGRKAKPSTIGNVKDAASTYLETARQDNIIVDSTDPATGATIKAYHNLKVYSSGDVLRINVGIFPVPGINFQLNDIFLQLPTQVA